MDLIIPRLYQGSLVDGKILLRDSKSLLKIQRVLNLSEEELNYQQCSKRLYVPDGKVGISQILDESVEFVLEGLRKQEVILVHCWAGVSRSSVIVVAVLVALGWDLYSAMNFQCIKRPESMINPLFMEELEIWAQKKSK